MSEDNIVHLNARAKQLGGDGRRQVFISHSTTDRAAVELVCDRLQQSGLEPWISHRHLDGRSEYSEQIERALRHSVAVIVVVSRAANKSSEVLKEVELALKMKRIVIPIIIEPGERPEGGLAYHLSAHNWLTWHSSPQAAAAVIASTVAGIDEFAVNPEPESRPYLATSMCVTSRPMVRDDASMVGTSVPSWAIGQRLSAETGANSIPLAEGVMLGHLRIRRTIAKTRQSICYEGVSIRDGKPYFIKEFYPADVVRSRDLSSNRVIWEKDGWLGVRTRAIKSRMSEFAGEAKILELLHSAGVPGVQGMLEANDTSYLVTEFIEGTSLAAHLHAHAPLSWREVYELLLVMLPVVQSCHDKGVFHGDIQPSNILITTSRPPVLVDFGAALAPSAGIRLRPSTITVTPGFTAPEIVSMSTQDSAAVIGPWSDLFSLAAVAFVAMTGRLPSIGDMGREANLLAAKFGSPPQLAAALAWCLSINPQHRPQRVADVSNLLQSIAA